MTKSQHYSIPAKRVPDLIYCLSEAMVNGAAANVIIELEMLNPVVVNVFVAGRLAATLKAVD